MKIHSNSAESKAQGFESIALPKVRQLSPRDDFILVKKFLTAWLDKVCAIIFQPIEFNSKNFSYTEKGT